MSKVIVAGSINMDIVAITQRHPNPGETVFGTELKYFPGGKGANQAVSSAKLGGDTTMIGMVGHDTFGAKLITFLEDQGITNQVEIVPETPTGTALIIVSAETTDNTIVVVPGANFKLTEHEIKKVVVSKGDILVSQFEIPIETIKSFFKKGREVGTVNILNPAPAQSIPKELLELVDIIILNETELMVISGLEVDTESDASITSAVQKIKKHDQTVVVTLGENGCIGFFNDTVIKIAGREVQALDSTGAGDCFVGAVASSLAQEKNLKESLVFANIAASICVTRLGAGPSIPTLDEVNQFLK